MKKKRAPLEQLKRAGQMARELLREKGFEAKHSILDEIAHSDHAPKLPGIPYYLPHRWTIKTAQQVMYDLLIMWQIESAQTPQRTENLAEFFQFMVTQMRVMEKERNQHIVNTPTLLKAVKNIPVLKDVFAPIQEKEALRAIHRFLTDSFAVAIAAKQKTSTSEFANWFLDWTQDLFALWVDPRYRDTLDRV